MFNSSQHLTPDNSTVKIEYEQSRDRTMGLLDQPIPGLGESNNSSSLAKVPNFQLSCKFLSCTWPKCPEPDLVKFSNFLQEQLSLWQPNFIRVAREQHKDGTHHLHAAISLSRRCRTRDCRFLDYLGHHANIQPSRHFNSWVNYIGKDGCILDYGTLPNTTSNKSGSHSGSGVGRLDPADIVRVATECKSRVEWLCWAAVNKVSYAKDIWDELHKLKDLNTIMEGTVSNGKLDYRFEQLILEVAWVKEKCLIIVGESGIGKTTYAINIAPKPCLMVSHIDDLRKFNSSFHKSILFDDVCFNHYPIQSQIHLVDFHCVRSIHIRYGVATIPAGTAKIFTCNEDPIDLSHPAISRRCQILKCHQPDLVRFN